MRTFVWAALVILVLAPCVRAEDETLAVGEVLAGLEGVGLRVHFSCDDSEGAAGLNLTEQKLRTKAELVLRRNHIPLLTEAEAREREGSPRLTVIVGTRGRAFGVSVRLYEVVTLSRDPLLRVVAATWMTGGFGMSGNSSTFVFDAMEGFIEEFALAYLRQSGESEPDVNGAAERLHIRREYRRYTAQAEALVSRYIDALEDARTQYKLTPDRERALSDVRSRVLKALRSGDGTYVFSLSSSLSGKLDSYFSELLLSKLEHARVCSKLWREELTSADRRLLKEDWRLHIKDLLYFWDGWHSVRPQMATSFDPGHMYYSKHNPRLQRALLSPPPVSSSEESLDDRRDSASKPTFEDRDAAWARAELKALVKETSFERLAPLWEIKHPLLQHRIREEMLILQAMRELELERNAGVAPWQTPEKRLWGEVVTRRSLWLLGTALDWGNAPGLND